jgi:hypothetical protein
MGILLSSFLACTKVTKIPRAEYDTAGTESSGNWYVDTSTTRYEVQRFSSTDTTLILEQVSWKQDIKGTGRDYPTGRIENVSPSEVPIVLSMKDVKSVGLVEFSKDRTTATVVLITVTALFVGFVFLLAGFLGSFG